jgi:hypothetical protein
MPQERFTNNATTTLNGTINNSTTSVVVTSASSFPTAGQFRIRIEDEIMLVTSISGSTFTATRAQEGTTAVSHTSGVTVRHVLTGDALRWMGKIVAAGTTTSTIAAAGATIDLSSYNITQGMANLGVMVRCAERVDGASSADPGDIWAIADVWFKRDDGASSGIPDDLRVRIRRLTGAASGYNVNIVWVIFELP